MAIIYNGVRRDGAGTGKRPIQFDFTNIDTDVFTETIAGDTILTYTVQRGLHNEIISITNDAGDVIDVLWPSGAYDEYSFLIGICIGRSMKGVTILDGIEIETVY